MSGHAPPGRAGSYPRPARTGVARVIPLWGWLRAYDRTTARRDLVAGLTVAVMLVPQSMAYAALAGLPPVTGLYAAAVPLLVYATFGSSGSLAVGPVAVTALLTGAALGPLADGDPDRYAALAALLALLVGSMQVLAGGLRLGRLVGYVPHAVLLGFTAAAAVLIAGSQLRDLLGLTADRAETLPAMAQALGRATAGPHGATMAVAAVSVAALLLLRRYGPRLPAALLVVAAVTAASAELGLGDRGVAVLGAIPTGLPVPAVPAVSVADVPALLPAALVIALVAYLEGIAVAGTLAARTGQPLHANQDLVAVGAANLAAGFWHAFPVAGGLSRTAVNADAGARTPVAGVVTAAAVALTAVALTPAFTHLPRAVLAALVIVAVLGLIDLRQARAVWLASPADGVVAAVTFGVTLMAGMEWGLGAGIGAGLTVRIGRRYVHARRVPREVPERSGVPAGRS